jgi:hypothetical protein
VRSLAAAVIVVSGTLGNAAGAAACPPTVTLRGDQDLVAAVAPVLEERGIETEPTECPALEISVERRGEGMVVSAAEPGGRPERREVTDARTAATVIESWVRTDLEAPLLEHRRRPIVDLEAPGEVVLSARKVEDRPGGLQLFTVGETTFANDRTTWVGVAAGACTKLGPACLGGRARLSTVTHGPKEWHSVMDREAADALVDLEVPLRIGRVGLSPGVAAGVGWIRTHEQEPPPDRRETVGLRAEAHFGLSYYVFRRFAAESMGAVAIGRTFHASANTREVLPGDPRFLARVGLGLRFEGL